MRSSSRPPPPRHRLPTRGWDVHVRAAARGRGAGVQCCHRQSVPSRGHSCVHLASIEAVGHDGDQFRVDLGFRLLTLERLFVATGRQSNLSAVALDGLGPDLNVETVETDLRMRAADGVWAIGDITGNGGFVKLIEDSESGVLIGATSAGSVGGEVRSEPVLAVHAEVPSATLRSTMTAFSTFHRAVGEALTALDSS